MKDRPEVFTAEQMATVQMGVVQAFAATMARPVVVDLAMVGLHEWETAPTVPIYVGTYHQATVAGVVMPCRHGNGPTFNEEGGPVPWDNSGMSGVALAKRLVVSTPAGPMAELAAGQCLECGRIYWGVVTR